MEQYHLPSLDFGLHIASDLGGWGWLCQGRLPTWRALNTPASIFSRAKFR